MHSRCAVVLFAMGVVVCGLTVPARAHAPDAVAKLTAVPVAEIGSGGSSPAVPELAQPIVDAIPAPPGPIWLLILAALAIPTMRSRRAFAGLLVALLAMLSVEAGVHSVHHIGEPGEAAQCAVAAASSHLNGAVGEPVVVVAPAGAGDVATRLDLGTPPWRVASTNRGRAPPFLA